MPFTLTEKEQKDFASLKEEKRDESYDPFEDDRIIAFTRDKQDYLAHYIIIAAYFDLKVGITFKDKLDSMTYKGLIGEHKCHSLISSKFFFNKPDNFFSQTIVRKMTIKGLERFIRKIDEVLTAKYEQVRKDYIRREMDDMPYQILLSNIKAKLPDLEELLNEINDHWCYEDKIYRFYHESFKVYRIQSYTLKIVNALKELTPEGDFSSPYDKHRENKRGKFGDVSFEKIIAEGASNKEFKMEHNNNWLEHTRPMLEAFFHAKFFLEMAVK
ncbi:MAG: hypothetical protein HQK79_23005, partial [Desulfobacterales bacterium]|nr:hypothetical protein [Desulfobacterales bacterium]